MPSIVNLEEYLPPVLRDVLDFQYIMNAESFEINELWKAFDDLMNDQFIIDATETGIKRWEKILKLKPVPGSTLEDRRFEILNRINVKIPYTFNMLKNKFNMLYKDNYILQYINDTLTLYIRIPSSDIKNLPSTRTMLNVISPSNLIIDLDVF